MDKQQIQYLHTWGLYNIHSMTGKNRDNKSGKYTTSYPDSDFLDAIEDLEGMASTADIADIVGCTHRTAYTRLQKIKNKGQVTSRKFGNSLVWVVSDR